MAWRRDAGGTLGRRPGLAHDAPSGLGHDAPMGQGHDAPMVLGNDAIVGVRRLLHTGLAVEVTIGAVGANRILPDDAGQVSTRQIGTRQIGTIEISAG
jgi:hypothetical protein